MDKWDKSEGSKDKIFELVSDWLTKEKDKPVLHRLSLNLTTEQLQKVSEALK